MKAANDTQGVARRKECCNGSRVGETFLKIVCGLGGGESAAADAINEKSAAIGHTTTS
jgi:hypothetical protein